MDVDWTSYCYEETKVDWDSYYKHFAEEQDREWEDNLNE